MNLTPSTYMDQNNPIKLWLADDDSADRELLIEALELGGMPYKIKEFTNGQELLDFLQQCNAENFPNFILLDLNMPVVDGREALKQIKASDEYKVIPVFILSTSNSKYDILVSYKSGANLFFVKPTNFQDLSNTVQSLLSLFHKGVANVSM